MEPTPHDALFRGIFGQPEHAAAELACVLPPELLACIDCATLEPRPATFVDDWSAHEPAALAARAMAAVARLAMVALRSTRDDAEFERQLGLLARRWFEARCSEAGRPSVDLVLR